MRITLPTLLALAIPALAQTTVKDALIKHWKTTGEFTLAVAKAMPAESYNFRPSPEEMNFGQLMAHIVAINIGACVNASGLARPALPPKIAAWAKDTEKIDLDKDTVLQFAADSFESMVDELGRFFDDFTGIREETG